MFDYDRGLYGYKNWLILLQSFRQMSSIVMDTNCSVNTLYNYVKLVELNFLLSCLFLYFFTFNDMVFRLPNS